jgi:hypothetical protein
MIKFLINRGQLIASGNVKKVQEQDGRINENISTHRIPNGAFITFEHQRGRDVALKKFIKSDS